MTKDICLHAHLPERLSNLGYTRLRSERCGTDVVFYTDFRNLRCMIATDTLLA